jgi:hypothetical protein
MIIRLSEDDVFGVDSGEYEILAKAAGMIKGIPGAVVEIGTRRGGSAKIIIDALEANQDCERPMFCIDPYGMIDIDCTNLSVTVHKVNAPIEGDPMSKDLTTKAKFDYDFAMKSRVIPSLYYYAYQRGLEFQFFNLEDSEFIVRYFDGVPVYRDQKYLFNEYAFVFFDGPHTNKLVELETKFFLDRAPLGAVFVYDDIWMYDHDAIEKIIFEGGFELVEKANLKASYKKVK